MSRQFGRNLDSHEGFDDVVSPVNVHHLQPHHHKRHEGIGQVQYAQLELTELLGNVQHSVHRRQNADHHEEEDAAPEPSDEPVDVEHVQNGLVGVLIILTRNKSTL